MAPPRIKPPTEPKPRYTAVVTLPDGKSEEVVVDGVKGPLIWSPHSHESSLEWFENFGNTDKTDMAWQGRTKKQWAEMGPTEMEVQIQIVAKKNRALRELHAEQAKQKLEAITPPVNIPSNVDKTAATVEDRASVKWNEVLKTMYGK
mmetsp:Transcript_150577/g.419674  ORF Transcript_150577/g.419674 Transcript_150577/m.419674 type:complete len:147 (-) Transcript_150577:175-615(-)